MTDTIFGKIIRREIPADIVYEDDRVLAFRDVNPVASTHVLVIPKEPIATLNDVEEKHESLIGHLLVVARKVAAAEGLAERGYRTVINCNEEGGQTVFHLHVHVIGGRAMGWPPFPEQAATG